MTEHSHVTDTAFTGGRTESRKGIYVLAATITLSAIMVTSAALTGRRNNATPTSDVQHLQAATLPAPAVTAKAVSADAAPTLTTGDLGVVGVDLSGCDRASAMSSRDGKLTVQYAGCAQMVWGRHKNNEVAAGNGGAQ